MDVAGCGVDVGVSEQCLHHRQIDTGLGHRGAERMAQCMWVTGEHSGLDPVIPEDRAQSGRGQRLTPIGAFGNQEKTGTCRLGSFGEQIGLDQPCDLNIEGNATGRVLKPV